MAVRTVSAEQALAHVTTAQHFGRQYTPAHRVATDLVGLHNTNQSTPFLSVRARSRAFGRAELEKLMWDEWRLARFRAMRMTMFVFPTDILEVAAAAVRPIVARFDERWLRDSALSRDEFDAIASDIEEALAGGPLTTRQLRQRLDAEPETDIPGVVRALCNRGTLIGGRPPRSWRSTVREYHRRGDVLPHVDIERWPRADAVADLLHRYIATYGPVTLDDMAWWSGLSKADCQVGLDQLDVEEIRVAGWPGPLWTLGLGPDEPNEDVVALPLLDPYVQGYRDRQRLIGDELFDHLYDRGGNGAATLLLRGRVIGVWQFNEKPSRRVLYHLFATEAPATEAQAEAELSATGELFFDGEFDIERVDDMTPLDANGGRSAAHPLDGRLHRASRRT